MRVAFNANIKNDVNASNSAAITSDNETSCDGIHEETRVPCNTMVAVKPRPLPRSQHRLTDKRVNGPIKRHVQSDTIDGLIKPDAVTAAVLMSLGLE